MNHRLTLALATTAFICATSPATAGISTTFGGCVQIAPPTVANFPTLLGPVAQCWNEQQNLTGVIQADLISIPGSNSLPVPGTLVGTYDCHFIHFTSSSQPNVFGGVTFLTPIVAVAWGDTMLDNTDGVWGATGTTYPTGTLGRGINAAAIVSAAGNTVNFQFAGLPGFLEIEQLRVWTVAVPAPGSCSLAAIGGLAALRRKRR